jgi:4-aminobutyrate aminotransferase-like enzyme
MMLDTDEKVLVFKELLVHALIKNIRSFGLWMAIEFDSFEITKQIIDGCIKRGVLSDWFLFAPNCIRIAPPLNITSGQVKQACNIIINELNALQ